MRLPIDNLEISLEPEDENQQIIQLLNAGFHGARTDDDLMGD